MLKKRTVPATAGQIRVNCEIALFFPIFNFAREKNLTDKANPCIGIKKYREIGRNVYIEDDLNQRIWENADIPTCDAMDLVYLTGQRPADVLKLDERNIKEGAR